MRLISSRSSLRTSAPTVTGAVTSRSVVSRGMAPAMVVAGLTPEPSLRRSSGWRNWPLGWPEFCPTRKASMLTPFSKGRIRKPRLGSVEPVGVMLPPLSVAAPGALKPLSVVISRTWRPAPGVSVMDWSATRSTPKSLTEPRVREPPRPVNSLTGAPVRRRMLTSRAAR